MSWMIPSWLAFMFDFAANEKITATDAYERKREEVALKMADSKNESLNSCVSNEIYLLSCYAHNLIGVQMLSLDNHVQEIGSQCRGMQESLIALSLLLEFDLLATGETFKTPRGREENSLA